MKKIYPYEQLMANKLEQLPVTGENENWLQMKAMLDEEMPKGAGAVLPSGKSASKLLSVILLAGIIILGVVLQPYFKTTPVNKHALNTSDHNNIASNTKPTTTTAAENTTANTELNTVITPQESGAKENTTSAANTGNVAGATNTESVTDNTATTAVEDNTLKPATKAAINKTTPKQNNHSAATSYNGSNKPKNDRSVALASNTKNNTINLPVTYDAAIANNNIAPNTVTTISTSKELKSAVIHEQKQIAVWNAASPANTFDKPIVYSGKEDKGLKIPVEVVSRKERKELKRSFKSVNIKNQGSNLSFAAGLMLPTSMSLSAQQKPAYNINATSNMITDYLPAPYLQYHINNKLFLHSELQFQSPQLTSRLLLSQNTQAQTPVSGIQNNIYAEKLYYFNIPVSVHYSLFNNFFIGTGVQFSSFISGVAGYEQRSYDGTGSTVTNYKAGRFQDDSLSNMLRPSDFRWQMDANYYIKRFTMGARYNRALNNVIDVEVGNTKTQARNQSLQLYIRYNLWEEKRK